MVTDVKEKRCGEDMRLQAYSEERSSELVSLQDTADLPIDRGLVEKSWLEQ